MVTSIFEALPNYTLIDIACLSRAAYCALSRLDKRTYNILKEARKYILSRLTDAPVECKFEAPDGVHYIIRVTFDRDCDDNKLPCSYFGAPAITIEVDREMHPYIDIGQYSMIIYYTIFRSDDITCSSECGRTMVPYVVQYLSDGTYDVYNQAMSLVETSYKIGYGAPVVAKAWSVYENMMLYIGDNILMNLKYSSTMGIIKFDDLIYYERDNKPSIWPCRKMMKLKNSKIYYLL